MTTILFSPARPSLKPFLPASQLAALVGALLLSAARAPAQTGDPQSLDPAISCIASNNYVVVSRTGDEPGKDIFARPASENSAKSCNLSQSPGWYHVVKAGEAKSALALQGKFLILDEGTGPSIRRLLIVDLAKARAVWSARYAPEPTPELSSHGLVFRKYLRTARKKDCRNAQKIILQGFTPLYVINGKLSFPDLAFRATGQPHCIAGQ